MNKTAQDELRGVIDSEEKWVEFCDKNYLDRLIYVPGYGNSNSDTYAPQSQWWAAREKARMDHVYKSSDVLTWVNQRAPWAFIHVSQDDPDMVALTVDPEAAKRDKQLKTTLGKALVKLFPYYRDEFIQRLVAEHKAEVNMVVEYLTEPLAIAAAYKGGVGSCMSHSETTSWKALKGRHPTEAYGNVKGLALAIIRGGDGKVKARTLVRPETKKYIRAYGDGKLLKYLQREGYKPGDLGGLTLNTVDLGDNKYILPYLDQNGSSGTTNRCTVAMIGGKIRVLTADEYSRWTRAGLTGHASGVTTAGYVTLTNVLSDEFSNEDMLTGEAYTGASLRGVYKDGRKGNTEIPATVLLDRGYIAASWTTFDTVYAPADQTFLHADGNRYVDDPKVRADKKYAELSQVFYPGERWTWLGKKGTVTTEEGQLIREEDAVTVLNVGVLESEPIVKTFWHKSEVMPKEYTKVHSPGKNDVVYAAPGMVWHRTSTGRKVVPGFHDVVQLWDKTWELRGSNKVHPVSIYGETYWFLDSRPADLTEDSPELVRSLLDRIQKSAVAEQHDGPAAIREWFETLHNYRTMRVELYEQQDGQYGGWITAWSWPTYRGLYHVLSEAEIGRRIIAEMPGLPDNLRAMSMDWYNERCRLDAERNRWNAANHDDVLKRAADAAHARAVAEFEALPTTVIINNLNAGGMITANTLHANAIPVSQLQAGIVNVDNVRQGQPWPFPPDRAIA